MDIFTIIIILNDLRDYFITFTHCNFQLFLYYARECSIIQELFIVTYYSQNYAGILGSGLLQMVEFCSGAKVRKK